MYKNILHYYVDLLRVTERKVHAVDIASQCVTSLYNTIRIMRYARHDLICGEDFSNLNFGNIPFNGIKFSLNGVMPCCFDGCMLNVWNLMSGHVGGIKRVAFSADGVFAVTLGKDEDVILWNVENGLPIEKLSEMRLHRMFPEIKFGGSSDVSSDGKYSLSISKSDGTGLLKNEITGEVKILKGHTNSISSLSFSPDGAKCITGSFDGTAIIWDVKSGMISHRLGGHSRIPSDFHVIEDKNILITMTVIVPIYRVPGENRKVIKQLWDLEKQKCILTQQCSVEEDTKLNNSKTTNSFISNNHVSALKYPYEIAINSDSFTLYRYNSDEQDDDYDLSGAGAYNLGTYYSIIDLYIKKCSFRNITANSKTMAILYQYEADI